MNDFQPLRVSETLVVVIDFKAFQQGPHALEALAPALDQFEVLSQHDVAHPVEPDGGKVDVVKQDHHKQAE